MECEFWLVSTDHLKDRLWFKDNEDFKAGMNISAQVAATYHMDVIAFILMSNHVHYVLSCSYSEAIAFIERFKRLYSQYYSGRYGSSELLRGNNVDIRQIYVGDESFERAVAYVQMNSVAANICINASDYSWGTGNSFFKTEPARGVKLGSLSKRAVARIVHSRVQMPYDYLVGDNGVIVPESYVNVKFVEDIFRTPKRMTYFLQNSSKARNREALPSFDDQIILSAIKNLCVSMFRRQSFDALDDSQKQEVVKQVRYRFSADPGQIARITGLSYDEITQKLENY